MIDETVRSAPQSGSEPSADSASVRGGAAASERVGVPAVDAVLAEIEIVGELPVAEQVGVFERAHEQLRRALDAADGPQAPRPGLAFRPEA